MSRRCDHDPVPADDGPSDPWLAIGLDLTLVPAARGGRSTAIRFTPPLGYRPNWGLPGMAGTEQTGAPVLCSSDSELAPGGTARVVIVPLADAHVTEWHLLDPGDTLRMFEGSRVCGHATVRWTATTRRPLPPADQARFCAWTTSGDDRP
jgi:hypothetical protein